MPRAHLPFGLFSTLEEVKKMCNDDISHYVDIPHNQSEYSTIWSSVAMTYNFMSPAHTDEDSFLIALIITYSSKLLKDKKKDLKYLPTMDVATHSCFPTKGVAVALRPGDVLFFNPLYYHCMSQRDAKYKNDEVFIISFYLKNRQISKSSNSIPLTDKILLKCDFFDQYLKKA